MDIAAQIIDSLHVAEAPRLFVLGSLHQRVTLYSQQVRALNLIWALRSTSLLDSSSRVAIIGGGAAGLTAASAAACSGCKQVDIYERHTEILPVFRGNDTRYLHPHVYDWPSKGWSDENAGLPILNWSAGTANNVALQIFRAFEAIRAKHSITLRVLKPTLDMAINLTSRGDWSLRWEKPSFGAESYDCVILAVGFGVELGSWKTVPIHPYWQNDDLHQPQQPVTSFLVTGCGDGGCVDLLRLRIRDFRHENLHKEFINARTVPDRLLADIQGIETLAVHSDPEENGRIISERYLALETPSLDKMLNPRIRLDTSATLHGRSKYPLSVRTSVLNRFLVSRLFRLTRTPYTNQEVLKVDRNDDSYLVQFETETSAFGRIIVRHGPVSPLKRDFQMFSERLTFPATGSSDFTRIPQYPDGFPFSLGTANIPYIVPSPQSMEDIAAKAQVIAINSPRAHSTKHPRVLLVKTAIPYPIKDFDFGVPLGLWVLRSYLRREGVEADIFDERLEMKKDSGATFEDALDGYDLVGISACSCEVPAAIRHASAAKKRGKTTIIGGIFALTNEQYLLSHAAVDYVIPGVATKPLSELVRRFSESSEWLNLRVVDVPGVRSIENVNDIRVQPASWMTDTLSSLGFDTLDDIIGIYGPHLAGKIDLITARGCPYRCDFCSIQRESGRKHITRNDSEVIEEILYLARRGFRRISIKDEIFPILIKRANTILRESTRRLSAEGISVEFKIKSRVDILSKQPELIKKYYEWGVREIQFGVETVNPELQSFIHKGSEHETRALKRFLEYVAKIGIVVNASLILGIDGESARYYDNLVRFVGGLAHLERFKVYVNFYTPHPLQGKWSVPARGKLFNDDLSCFTHKIPLVSPSTISLRAQREAMLNAYDRLVDISQSASFNPPVPGHLREIFLDGLHDYAREPIPIMQN